MAKGKNQKLKMLYLVKIFTEYTDGQHSLTMQEIIKKLESYDVSADRKTLYLDFEELEHFGLARVVAMDVIGTCPCAETSLLERSCSEISPILCLCSVCDSIVLYPHIKESKPRRNGNALNPTAEICGEQSRRSPATFSSLLCHAESVLLSDCRACPR